jgi:hypothetical protein
MTLQHKQEVKIKEQGRQREKLITELKYETSLLNTTLYNYDSEMFLKKLRKVKQVIIKLEKTCN